LEPIGKSFYVIAIDPMNNNSLLEYLIILSSFRKKVANLEIFSANIIRNGVSESELILYLVGKNETDAAHQFVDTVKNLQKKP